MAGKKSKTFEENLNRIDDIITQMESEDLSFNKSVDLYKEGLKLINDCSKQIENAQQQVYKLEEDFSLTEFLPRDERILEKWEEENND